MTAAKEYRVPRKGFYSTSVPLPELAVLKERMPDIKKFTEAATKAIMETLRHDVFCPSNTMCRHWEENIDEFAKEVDSTGV